MSLAKYSTYKSAAGNTVELYKTTKGMFTVVKGEITIYDADGNMLSGAKDVEAALRLIGADGIESSGADALKRIYG
jgi:hypothetical protein